MPYALEIDPTSENASNVPLSLTSTTVYVLQESFPMPPVEGRFIDQEQADGSQLDGVRYGNREITLTVECRGTTAALTRTAVMSVLAKVGKINREGGTLKRTNPSNETIVFDLLTAQDVDPELDVKYHNGNVAVVPLRFTAKPFGRGAEQSYTLDSETTLPVLVAVETAVPGDVPALGRLEVTEAQAVDQAWVVWGIQSRNYDAAATASLFYEAEGRTLQGSAAIATVTGASGGGSNNAVTQSVLTASWQSMLSTQATGGGAHLTHIGRYRVFARVQQPTTNTGTVSLALEWSTGDFLRSTRNTAVTFSPDNSTFRGAWTIVDLGTVQIDRPVVGSARWEGRFVAKSTVLGDDLSIDCFWLVPIDEASGQVVGNFRPQLPTSHTARDEFDQTAGALAGKVAPVGGTWAGAGSATDFQVTGSGFLTRTFHANSDIRYARLGVGTAALVSGSVDISVDQLSQTNSANAGMLLRYVDTSNYAVAFLTYSMIQPGSPGKLILRIAAYVAGTPVALNAMTVTTTAAKDYTWRLTASVDAIGRMAAAVGPLESPPDNWQLWLQHSSLATGGTLASGGYGLYDASGSSSTTVTRRYDNFRIWGANADAAVYASRKLEWRHDRVLRQDSAGAVYASPTSYEGDLLLVPPAGPENRSVRFIVKASRGVPGQGADLAIDDISARLHVTPRYLVIP